MGRSKILCDVFGRQYKFYAKLLHSKATKIIYWRNLTEVPTVRQMDYGQGGLQVLLGAKAAFGLHFENINMSLEKTLQIVSSLHLGFLALCFI